MNAATEQHANTYSDEEDLSNSKALTRGTEDIDNRNVGCQDPRTSFKASAQGTSAKCIETTPVVLESVPHEMQDWSRSSLPLTPRPPNEGEPGRCKQEVADSITTAGRTNRTVKLAEPTEPMAADVDRTAMLGRDLMTACGVDEGAEMKHKELRPQETTNLLCKEIVQHNGNAENDVPNALGLPLEGEWTAYPSSKTTDSKGVELEGREGGTDEPYVEDSGDIPRVYLGGTRMRTGDMNSPGNRADRSEGQSDVSKGHGEGARTYLGIGDAKHIVKETDGVESHADVSTGHGDISSVKTNANKPAKAPDNVSIPRKKIKPPDIPDSATRRCSDESNACGNQTDTSSPRTGTQSVGDVRETAEKETQNVRNCRNDSKTQNTPYTTEVATFKHTYRRRMVSVNDSDVYLPSNAPIEAPGQTFTFGEPESGGEAIAPNVEGERASDGDGGQDSDDGDGDGDGMASQRCVASWRSWSARKTKC